MSVYDCAALVQPYYITLMYDTYSHGSATPARADIRSDPPAVAIRKTTQRPAIRAIRHLTARSMSRGALDTASSGELLDVVAFLGDLIRSTPASRRPLVRRRLYSAAQFVHAAASQHPANRRELAEMAGLRGLSRTAGLGAPGRRRAARWLSRRLHTRGVARG